MVALRPRPQIVLIKGSDHRDNSSTRGTTIFGSARSRNNILAIPNSVFGTSDRIPRLACVQAGKARSRT